MFGRIPQITIIQINLIPWGNIIALMNFILNRIQSKEGQGKEKKKRK
jgi:hypothetical protein